jgi:hypothetical protein
MDRQIPGLGDNVSNYNVSYPRYCHCLYSSNEILIADFISHLENMWKLLKERVVCPITPLIFFPMPTIHIRI